MKQVLIIKHGALGDIIQGIDAFASLREGLKDANITMMTSPAFAPLMRQMPYFDDVIIDERAPVWQLAKTFRIRAAFQRSFDIIIDLQCSKRTAQYHKYFASSDSRWLGVAKGCSDPYPDFTNVNNRDRMLTAAHMLGCQTKIASLDFLSSQPLTNFSLPHPYAVLMPGCSPAKPSKKWPQSHYSDLAFLLKQKGINPLVVGTKQDQEACDFIAESHDFVMNLCGKTDLAALARLCAGASYCIGNDSGPVFLAARTDAKTLMLMGPDTNPAMSAPVGGKAAYLKVDDLAHLTADEVMIALER